MKYTAVLAFAVSAVYAGVVPDPVYEEPTTKVAPTSEPVYEEPTSKVEVPTSDPVYEEPTTSVEVPEVTTSADEGPEYTTEIVTSYTTYCPEPTTITDGDNTITVTEPTVITITHCPGGCTIERPCTTTTAVECEDGSCEGPEPTGPAEEPSYAEPEPTYGEEPESPEEPEVSGGEEGSSPAEPTGPVEAGAATLAGAGLASFVGLVAFLL